MKLFYLSLALPDSLLRSRKPNANRWFFRSVGTIIRRLRGLALFTNHGSRITGHVDFATRNPWLLNDAALSTLPMSTELKKQHAFLLHHQEPPLAWTVRGDRSLDRRPEQNWNTLPYTSKSPSGFGLK